jgi:hypothetical protein
MKKTRTPQACKEVLVMQPANPKGRVDILLRRLAEVATRKLEARFQIPGIWENFARPIVEEKAKEIEGMGPVEFGRYIGFLKPENKRKRLGKRA